MEIPFTAAVELVLTKAPTVRGTMVTGRSKTFVKEARTFRFIKAGFCESRKRADCPTAVACDWLASLCFFVKRYNTTAWLHTLRSQSRQIVSREDFTDSTSSSKYSSIFCSNI